jgi:YesN/AraC family two-component response regulator
MNEDRKMGADDGKKVVDNKIYKILIVDDEEGVLDTLRMTMLKGTEQFKREIYTANSGDKALKEIEKKEFDLVLADYKMPGTNGVELLAKVKEKHPNTVRMLITGYSDIKIARDAINKAQVHNYIEKPWDNEDVRSTVCEALKRKTERESEALFIVDTVKDALIKLKEFQKNIKDAPKEYTSTEKMVFLFTSPGEFNKFSLSIREMKNVLIDDIQIFETKYIISVVVHPKS